MDTEQPEQIQTLGSRVLEFAQNSADRVSEQAHSISSRVSELAHSSADKLGKLRDNAGVRAGVLATSAVALLGGATYSAVQPAEALANGPAPATLKYVDKAKLPLARDVIKTFRHTKHSKRHVKRHTNELGGLSYRNITEISAIMPAKSANGRTAGEYSYIADFKGAIKPKNFIATIIAAIPNKNDLGRGYAFTLARTTHDGPTTVMPMHWFMSSEYARGSKDAYHAYDSCSATGSIGGNQDIMTAPILNTGMRQARSVLGQMRHHRPIRWQKDLMRSQKPADAC